LLLQRRGLGDRLQLLFDITLGAELLYTRNIARPWPVSEPVQNAECAAIIGGGDNTATEQQDGREDGSWTHGGKLASSGGCSLDNGAALPRLTTASPAAI
jgi:hypothetical protein